MISRRHSARFNRGRIATVGNKVTPLYTLAPGGTCLRCWQSDSGLHQTGAKTCDSWLDTFARKQLAQPTLANQPIVTVDQSSHKVQLQFNGSTNVLTEDTVAPSLAGAFTVITHFTYTGATTQFMFAAAHLADTTNSVEFSIITNALVIKRLGTGSGTVTTAQTLTLGNKYVVTYLFDGALATIRINGSTTSVNGTALGGGTTTLDTFTLGTRHNSGGFTVPLTTNRFDVLALWSTPLAATDYTAVENYIMANW